MHDQPAQDFCKPSLFLHRVHSSVCDGWQSTKRLALEPYTVVPAYPIRTMDQVARRTFCR